MQIYIKREDRRMKTKCDINALSNAYYKLALIKATFEYYMLYERESEKETQDEEVIRMIHSSISNVLSDKNVDKKEVIKKIESYRNQVIEKMQVLTAYTDRLQIYEYVLNRLEQRYYPEDAIDEELFANKLFQYIFSIKDNMLINEIIKESIGQLPIRMTKNRYLDLIRESITLYKGSDKESLDAYLYMLRTSAMLYEPDGMKEYFLEYKEELELFEKADYNVLTEDEYNRLTVSLTQMADDLVKKTDFYVYVQELLNSLDTIFIALCSMDKEEWDKEQDCKQILSVVYSLFMNPSNQEKLTLAEEKLSHLEGQQEKAHDMITRLEACLVSSNEKKLDDILLNLEKMGKLMSSSIFVELENKENTCIADESYIEYVTKKLMEDLLSLFHKNCKRVNHAIMASTRNKMPVFFIRTAEVMDDIKNSV